MIDSKNYTFYIASTPGKLRKLIVPAYVLHGLAGVGLIALIMVHVYFAIRPEKLVITKSMIVGTLAKDHYLEHHDPQRWVVAGGASETERSMHA